MINLHEQNWSGASVKIGEAKSLSPFEYGLEYGSPARGLWNIVHTGMLLPESHQVFVCAQGCLRGVVLTAAEMGAQERFSTVAICEHNVVDGNMENLVIDGVADVIRKLPQKPKAVLVFTSCIHHFMGCDLKFVYAKLREQFPDIYFTDCYMYPIMRKTTIPPDPMTRMRLYSFLERTEERDEKIVNIIGNNYPTELSSDFVRMLRSAGYEIRDITKCRTWDEYTKMSRSALNIAYMPPALHAVKDLENRLGTDYLYIPVSYNEEEIERYLSELSSKLGIPKIDTAIPKAEAENALDTALKLIRKTPIVIDYTATPRPLELAELLLKRGFNVRTVYADVFSPEDKPAFDRLKISHPELELCATVHPKMGILPRVIKRSEEKIVAIGQKAAYFTNTPYFVNMLECGGRWGYDGIAHIAEDLCDAFIDEKDTKKIIQVKGWGCCC